MNRLQYKKTYIRASNKKKIMRRHRFWSKLGSNMATFGTSGCRQIAAVHSEGTRAPEPTAQVAKTG